MSSGHKWRPLAPATAKPPTEALIVATMAKMGCDRDEALRVIVADEEIWLNDLYQVVVHRFENYVHLNIRRVDGYPGRDWRHFQQIKNELVGEECEGVELYPAESRLVDQSNKYHLFVCGDPTFRWPFGWTTRDVDYAAAAAGLRGMRQRPPMQFARRPK